MPLSRRILLKGAVIVQYIFYRVKLTDAHNGFRAFSRHAAQTIELKQSRMEHASEIIEEINKKKLRYKEVPVIIRYNEETLKKGHGGFIQAIKVFSKMLFKKLIN